MPTIATHPPLPALSPRNPRPGAARSTARPPSDLHTPRAHRDAESPDDRPQLPASVDVDLLLIHLARGESPRDCARSHCLKLDTLLAWAEHPATRHLINRLREAEARRARDQRDYAAIHSADIYRLRQQLKLPPHDAPVPEQLRAMETALKAAIAILYPPRHHAATLPLPRIPALFRRLFKRSATDVPTQHEQPAPAPRPHAPPTIPLPGPEGPAHVATGEPAIAGPARGNERPRKQRPQRAQAQSRLVDGVALRRPAMPTGAHARFVAGMRTSGKSPAVHEQGCRQLMGAFPDRCRGGAESRPVPAPPRPP